MKEHHVHLNLTVQSSNSGSILNIPSQITTTSGSEATKTNSQSSTLPRPRQTNKNLTRGSVINSGLRKIVKHQKSAMLNSK